MGKGQRAVDCELRELSGGDGNATTTERERERAIDRVSVCCACKFGA